MILTSQSGALSLKQQYEKDISDLGNEIHFLGLNELEIREKEVKLFEESIEQAQKEAQLKGVKTVLAYFFLKKKFSVTNF